MVFRSPVQIWDENVAIQTTTLGNNAGAAITFENKIEGQLQAPGNYLARGLTLSAGDYRDWETDRKSTRLNSSHLKLSRMPSSA